MAVTTMFAILLLSLTVTRCLVSFPGAAAQGTNVTCNAGFEWMTNSKQQNPCLVSSYLFTPCSSQADYFVFPLPPGYHYGAPLNTTESATPCRCNTILFSTLAACATCQGEAEGILQWYLYSQNCSAVFMQQYPENIPSGTAIPAWAYLEVQANNTFDPAAAEAVVSQNLPESTALPAPSQTLGASTSIDNLVSQSTTEGTGTTSGALAPTEAGESQSSGPGKKSHPGAIAGGVVGGVVGLAVVVTAVFFLFRTWSCRSAADWKNTVYGTNIQSWESSVSTQQLYNPNDPRTYPLAGQYSYASRPGQASRPYLATDSSTGVVELERSLNRGDSHRGAAVASFPHAYRGAPEL